MEPLWRHHEDSLQVQAQMPEFSAPLVGSSICTDKWRSLPSPTVEKDGSETILRMELGLPSSFLGPSPVRPVNASDASEQGCE